MRRALVPATLIVLALPARAAASEPDDRPFGRGVILPSLALGGSFARGYGGSLLVGAGASYFVAPGLAVGLHVRNVTSFYSQSYKDYLGDAFAQVPTNVLSVTPGITWVIYRSRRVAPYIHAGIGPVFLNKHRPALGQWTAGPGVMIGTGGGLFFDLGIGFSMMFPRSRCERAYTFVDPSTSTTFVNEYACSLVFGFRGGLVFGFGGRREPRPSAPPPNYAPPPSYSPPPSYPPPSAPPPSAPVEAVPEDSAAPAPAPAPEPAPAGESLPVPPPA